MPDSQLILLAYAKWGEESPKYLVGDFAFMIWDKGNRHFLVPGIFLAAEHYIFTKINRNLLFVH